MIYSSHSLTRHAIHAFYSLAIISLLSVASLSSAQTLFGFDANSSAQQRQMEGQFDGLIDSAEMDRWLKDFSSEAHHVGSPKSKENAEAIADLLRSWNYDVEIAEYEVLFPEPVTRELELVAPNRFTASLTEDPVASDASTSNTDNLLPPYNAFSIGGEVEADLVFVNYGTPADYELLERYGISVAGKIALSKYGGSWRGIKPKLA